MTEALRSNGTSHIVPLSDWPQVNLGTAYYVWEYYGKVAATPAGLVGFLGTSAATTSSGFATNANNQLRAYSAGANRFGTGNDFIIPTEDHHYRMIHNTDGTWGAYRDDMVTPLFTGTFTTSNITAALNQAFRSSSSSTMYLAADTAWMRLATSTFDETLRSSLSGGVGNVWPTDSGNNQGALNTPPWPTDDSQWVGFGGGGTAQPVTSIDAQQLTEAITALISSRQVAASVPAEQSTQAVTASLALKQSVVSIPAEQLTESTLVTIAVTMGVTVADAEQQTQSVLAAASVRQVVTAGVAEQITQAVTVNIGQGAGSQVVTSINAQQLTEAVTASAAVRQVVTALPAEQLTEAATAAVRMAQVVTSIDAEQITQCVVVEISQPGDSGTSQPVTAIQCEQITQAVIAVISNHQVVTALPAEQLTEAVTAPVSISQKIQAVVAEQLTEAVTAGEALPPTFVAFNIKVTVLPSPFTIKDVTPVFKAYQ